MERVEEPKRKLKNVDDIVRDLNEIADDSDAGPDRFRALKMLHSINTSNAQVLHQPLIKADRMERWIRLFRPAGKQEIDEAYYRAFGMRSKPQIPARAQADQLPPETVYKISRIKTVKQFHKMCPELKKPGHPGYRKGAGDLEKSEYFQAQATQYFIDKINLEVVPSGFAEHRAVQAETKEQEVPEGS